MSKQAQNTAVNFNAPKPGGLCAVAWELFADARNKNKPYSSKDLPGIAERTGLNLTNLRIEFSRFNRYCTAHGLYA